jgi:hypothetical protein
MVAGCGRPARPALLLRGHSTDNGCVRPVIELVIVVLLPTAAGYALIYGFRGVQWSSGRWYTHRHRLDPPAEPIERLGASLRRLRAELDETETRSGVPAKNLRLKALRGAYVDALCTACERLEVSPPPGGDRAPLAEIYRVEAALRQRGLDVREKAAR